MNAMINHPDQIRRRILRIHGSFLLVLTTHFQSTSIFSIVLHTVWICIEMFAILYRGQSRPLVSAR